MQQTENLANKFASLLLQGDVVLLNGDLGAGKTCFSRCVMQALGVKSIVNSPTFAILKTYQGKFVFNHFDFYRINTAEAIEAGFDEVLSTPNSIKFIEWGQNVEPLIPQKHIIVNITFVAETVRKFEIIFPDNRKIKAG